MTANWVMQQSSGALEGNEEKGKRKEKSKSEPSRRKGKKKAESEWDQGPAEEGQWGDVKW